MRTRPAHSKEGSFVFVLMASRYGFSQVMWHSSAAWNGWYLEQEIDAWYCDGPLHTIDNKHACELFAYRVALINSPAPLASSEPPPEAWRRAALEQIQLSLGHGTIVTTGQYLGVRQDLPDAPCEPIHLLVWDMNLPNLSG